MNELQRTRLISAAAQAVEDVGYRQVTVTRVIEHAKVSRKTFYDAFENWEDCAVALFDGAVEQARSVIRDDPQPKWREVTRLALGQILRLIDEEPGLARFCLVEALAGGEVLLARHARLAGELAQLIDRGFRVATTTRKPTTITAEGVVGAVAYILQRRLRTPGSEPVLDMLGPLMGIIVLPYLGDAVAREELSRPAPDTKPLPRREMPRRDLPRNEPLVGLSRLTVRTARVLSVIREHPGSSNREIGERSGIVDQGQISKLLARLAGNLLVENRGGGQRHGLANAWYLTTGGQKVQQAVTSRFGLLDPESVEVHSRRSIRGSTASR